MMTTVGFVLAAADDPPPFADAAANELIDETVKSSATEKAIVKIFFIFIDISPS